MDTVPNNYKENLLHIDVCLDEHAPRAGITELFKTLRPQWKAEDIQMKVFTEGITNRLVGCYVGSVGEAAVVLVRVYGRKTELFVDRKRELEMFRLLHAHGCGPQLYCSFQNGICYEFLKGTPLDDPLLTQPAVYRLVAAEMGKLHSIKPKAVSSLQPVLWSKLSNYLNLLQNSASSDAHLQQSSQLELPSMDVLLKEMENLRRHLTAVDSPIVLCHNDLLTKNIIYNSTEGAVKFIDYEYADFNYQAYDIGNHFNEYAGVNNVDYSLYPSQDLQWDWLTEYLHSLKSSSGVDAAVTEREVQELYIKVCKFSLAANFSWGLWALIQAKHSTIDFDFQRYAAARLSYYFEKKEEYFGMKLP
ncbi:ethanolamine kinase 1 isoform X1 [Pygocentrus nattereri]|uniref:ethanolamine kinase n=1 Tax=Pygocentrus nattereri TaxID=42514 RepID=A0AAR2IS63_PYGNA|nr:ethanolamine kinase 1 isoform X1 [Pygocentrus nattereri]